ncbi:uncharacterized protein G2W53_018897 [Senna tora]|uniref:Uncharacterized protein n=1 Tax=Senna tora TaxID=362788 RepID=A0A834WNR4_9FABA|nr:uncharacterized protein G2W53_018897 [Senna tora]
MAVSIPGHNRRAGAGPVDDGPAPPKTLPG